MPQLDFYSYIYQFCWGIGGWFFVYWVLISHILPKFLYRELCGTVKRDLGIETTVRWEEEFIRDLFYLSKSDLKS